mgnify:CR=1 FL=1
MKFSGSKDKVSTKQPALISEDMDIVGDLNCAGDIKIDGRFKGNIKCSGRVVIGKSGKVVGNLSSVNILVQGFFKGKLECSGVLSVVDESYLQGKFHYNNLDISHGAELIGEIRKLNETQLKELTEENKNISPDGQNFFKHLEVVKEDNEPDTENKQTIVSETSSESEEQAMNGWM